VTARRAARCLAVLAAAAFAATASAQPVAYRIDPALTRVEFSVLHLGILPADGRFTQATGHVVFDAAMHTGRIDVDVAGASVASGWSLRDAFIRGENMFDVERHPVVRFRSPRLVFAEERLARVDGELTLRGVTRPVSLTVTHVACGSGAGTRCVAAAEGVIRRRDFGMDFAWPLIGDEVSLRFAIVALREDPVMTALPFP
jgi:polyisoprenoid-binding protein YceI